MKRKPAILAAVALVMFSFSVSLVRSDQTLVDENVTLYGSGDPLTRIKTWDLALDGGSTVSISIAVNGDPVNFEIYAKDSQDNKLLQKNDVTSVEEQWTVPNSDTFTFWLEGSVNGRDAYGNATVHVTIRATAGKGGGGFDPLPAVVVVLVVIVVLVSAFFIFRLRQQSALPPPPPPEEPPPP
jgi:hypothetical protein